MSARELEDQFDKILTERDPEKRRAMSRRLRAEIFDMLGEADRIKIGLGGVDISAFRRGLREIE